MQDKLYLTWDNNPNKVIDALWSRLSDKNNGEDTPNPESLEEDTESNQEASATQNLQLASPSSTNETSNQGFEMQNINWLHLSDWHQKGKEFGREVVRDKLIENIKKRAEISPDLAKIDFIVFSGDLAHSGSQQEYEAAKSYLLDPVLEATGLSREKLFFVPGNHDFDRNRTDLFPPEIKDPFANEEDVNKWLTDVDKREAILRPFKAYKEFVTLYIAILGAMRYNRKQIDK